MEEKWKKEGGSYGRIDGRMEKTEGGERGRGMYNDGRTTTCLTSEQ